LSCEKCRLGNEPPRTQRTQREERRKRDVIFTNDLGLLYVKDYFSIISSENGEKFKKVN
jgi:hypothetical protein